MKTVVVRIHEWTEWVPSERDGKSPLMMSRGKTSFQAEDHEKVMEVAVSATGQQKHFPVSISNAIEPANPKTENRKFGLYAFQAVLVHQAAEGEELPTSPVPDKDDSQSKLVMPGDA